MGAKSEDAEPDDEVSGASDDAVASGPRERTAPRDADDPRIGTVIDRHVLVRRIGRGAMGTVYLAEHESIGSRLAVKVLHQQAAEDSLQFARMHREASAVNRVRHPNIVRIHDLGFLEDGHPYVSMELLEGESLKERMRRGPPIPVRTLQAWARQILDALGAAHAAGYVHRDLKPDNVFVQKDGQIRLLDFGIAKVLGEGGTLTQEGMVVGSPIYLSPEQAKGTQADVGPASDLYSFGVLLFELFTGEPPFIDRSLTQLLVAHATEAPPAPSALEPRVGGVLETLILELLTKSPARRPADARALADRLDRALDAHIAAHPQGEACALPPNRTEAAFAPGSSSSRPSSRSGSHLAHLETLDSAASASGVSERLSASSSRSTLAPPEVPNGGRRLAVLGLAALVLGGAAAWMLATRTQEPPVESASAAVAPSVGPSGTLVVALPGRPNTLDPVKTTIADTSRVLHQVFEPLVRIDELTLEPQPVLATAWEAEGEGRWRFTLREGVRFHDGRPLDAMTASAAIEHGLVPLGIVRSVEPAGEGAIRVTTELGPPVFFAQLGGPNGLLALPAEPERPTGTGPFQVESANLPVGLVTLSANAEHWGGPPGVARIVFRTAAEEDLRVDQLRDGSAQLAIALLPDTAATLRAEGELAVVKTRENTVAFVALNTKHAALVSREARRAVAMAIDHRRIAEEAYRGTPAAGLVPPALGGRPGRTERRHDPAEARAELERLGLTGTTLRALFVSEQSSWNPDPRGTEARLREDLEAVGLELEARLLPLDDLDRERFQSAHAMLVMGWLPDYPDPLTYYYLLTEAWREISHETEYASPAFEAAYRASALATEPSARDAHHATMDRVMSEDWPIVPLAFVAEHHAHHANVQGIRFGLGSGLDLSRAHFVDPAP
ncbi:MAG: ABC transporter substrate-binding protein [Myxococcota bacterium]